MSHRVDHVALMSPGPGTERFLTVHRFGRPGGRPRIYYQAGLRADELPGTLVLNHMLAWLGEVDAADRIAGEIVVVPCANPVGLAGRVMESHIGRFALDGDGDFNLWFPQLADAVAERVAPLLGRDESANGRIVHEACLGAVHAWQPAGEADTLRKALLSLSIDCDAVFDLHCAGEAVLHLCLPENRWARHGDIAGDLGCEAAFLFDAGSGTAFNRTAAAIWHELARRFAHRPIAEAPLSVVVVLLGKADVGDAEAARDAAGLQRFLLREGIVTGTPPPEPGPRPAPARLAASDRLVAPCAGVVSYRIALGARVAAGDVVADIVDPARSHYARARTPVRSRATGIFYRRAQSRLVRPGQVFAAVSEQGANGCVGRAGAGR